MEKGDGLAMGLPVTAQQPQAVPRKWLGFIPPLFYRLDNKGMVLRYALACVNPPAALGPSWLCCDGHESLVSVRPVRLLQSAQEL